MNTSGHPYLVMAFATFVCLSNFVSTKLAAGDETTADQKRIDIWNAHAPLGNGNFENVETWITVHRAAKPNGTAVIICPGGGYGGLVTGPEGHGIATWLNRHGIAGIVLEYRLPKGRSTVPLSDAQRAIRLVRANAKQWDVDSDRIGIIGFSAGGHLAATAATHSSQFDGNPKSNDAVERVSCRPDFAILIYPVISLGELAHAGTRANLLGANPSAEQIKLFSNEKQVDSKTAPTFLAHAKDDTVVVIANSQMFHDALKAHHVPGEFLELASGGHGLNGYQGPMWDAWQEKSLEWLKSQKFIR